MQRAFGFLTPSPTSESSALRFSAHGQQLLRAPFVAAIAPAASVIARLRTTVSYIDRREVGVAYQWRDASGNVDVDSSSTTITLSLDVSSGSQPGATISTACSAPAAGAGGVGACAISVPQNWYDIAGMATARVVVAISSGGPQLASSEAGRVELVQAPLWVTNISGALSGAGMVLAAPVSARYVGEEFTVEVRAHTGDYALRAWGLRIFFPSASFEYVQSSSSALFNPAAVQTSSASDSVSAAAVGILPSTSDADVLSASLLLLTITFRVKASAALGVQQHALRLAVDEMVNPGNNVYLQDAAGYAADGRGVSNTSARLTVIAPSRAALFAWTASAHMANMAPLSGASSVQPISLVWYSDQLALGASALSLGNMGRTSVACSAANATGALRVEQCTVIIDAAQTSGGDFDLNIQWWVGSEPPVALAASTPLSVYYPSSFSVSVDDAQLGRLAFSGGGCVGTAGSISRYEHTYTHAHADGLDVTPLVTFTLDSGGGGDAVAQLDGSLVRGVAPGVTAVCAASGTPIFAAAAIAVCPLVGCSRGRSVGSCCRCWTRYAT